MEQMKERMAEVHEELQRELDSVSSELQHLGSLQRNMGADEYFNPRQMDRPLLFLEEPDFPNLE